MWTVQGSIRNSSIPNPFEALSNIEFASFTVEGFQTPCTYNIKEITNHVPPPSPDRCSIPSTSTEYIAKYRTTAMALDTYLSNYPPFKSIPSVGQDYDCPNSVQSPPWKLEKLIILSINM